MNDLNDPLADKEAQLRARISRLQAQQRRQKLIEDLEKPRRSTSGGFRFIHAFLIVLGLHAAAVGGFYALSAVRKMHVSDKMALNEKTPVYAGVPDPSPLSAQAPALSQATKTTSTDKTGLQALHPRKKKQDESVAATMPAKKASPPNRVAKQEQDFREQCIQRISPAIKALFTHHSASSSAQEFQPHGGKSISGAAEALASLGKQNPEAETPPALVATPQPAPPIPSEYTVAPGDTLSKVASMMGVPASKICDANGLDSGSNLQVGRKLTIPKPENHHTLQLVEKSPEFVSKKENDPEVFTPKMEKIAPNGVYTVQRGDNPYAIAHRLGVSFYDLMTANDISNPADVTIGMHLKVPQKRIASN